MTDAVNCTAHPHNVALASCTQCEATLCLACIHRGEDGLARCLVCPSPDHREAEVSAPPAADQTRIGDTSKPSRGTSPKWIAWENPAIRNGFGAFFKTVIDGITQPTRYVKSIDYGRVDLKTPLIFAIIAGTIGKVADALRLFSDPEKLAQISERLKTLEQKGGEIGSSASQTLASLQDVDPLSVILPMLPMLPILVIIALFIKCFIAHSMLKLLNGANQGFVVTFRVFAYTEVTALFLCFPMVGPYAHRFMYIFMLLTGLRVAQRIQLSTAMFALIPTIIMQSLYG
jgi:hypothetical protein